MPILPYQQLFLPSLPRTGMKSVILDFHALENDNELNKRAPKITTATRTPHRIAEFGLSGRHGELSNHSTPYSTWHNCFSTSRMRRKQPCSWQLEICDFESKGKNKLQLEFPLPALPLVLPLCLQIFSMINSTILSSSLARQTI